MDRINENLYQANIELVDRNKLLEKDVSILQKRIDRAIEIIEQNENKAPIEVVLNDIGLALKVLKGEEDGDNR